MSAEFQILDWIQGMHTPAGDKLMVFITQLGNAGMIWIALTVLFLAIPKMRKTGLVMGAALAVDLLLCNGILKNLIARVRPCDVNQSVQLLITRPTDFSFPSGHTAASFAAVTALYMTGQKKLWKPALVLAALIAFSRMYLYVHYPTDILGGIAAGIAAGVLGYELVRKFEKAKKEYEEGEEHEHRDDRFYRKSADDFPDTGDHRREIAGR